MSFFQCSVFPFISYCHIAKMIRALWPNLFVTFWDSFIFFFDFCYIDLCQNFT